MQYVKSKIFIGSHNLDHKRSYFFLLEQLVSYDALIIRVLGVDHLHGNILCLYYLTHI